MFFKEKIKMFDKSKEKEEEIRLRAKKCLKDKIVIKDPKIDLSKQLFENAPTLYLNPTEELLLKDVVKEGEPFLTVLDSGDSTIDSIYHGAGEVVSFDINKNQFFLAIFKIKAFQNMDYEDYFNFFSNAFSNEFLSPKVYENLEKMLKKNPEIKTFMDEIMNQRKIDQQNMEDWFINAGMPGDYHFFIETLHFINPDLKREEINEIVIDKFLRKEGRGYKASKVFRTFSGLEGYKTSGSYLESEDAYKSAQNNSRRKNITFLNTDISKLNSKLENIGYKNKRGYNGFGGIYLSNVGEYLTGTEFRRVMDEELMPLLQGDGVISYCVQGTSVKKLHMSDEELENLSKNANLLSNKKANMFALLQLLNSVEGLRQIEDLYDVSFKEKETMSSTNGFENKDTYVYVKKK